MMPKKSFGRRLVGNNAFQTIVASVLCVIIGLVIGYVVLLCINPDGAFKAVTDMLKNFMTYSRSTLRIKNLGTTLVTTVPLILCSLSILFCYKAGLFNIGVAGQYVIGAGVALYSALAWGLPWYACILLAIVAGAVLGTVSGLLKAYCNVNEVISGIMLNWISIYCVNMLLTNVKEPTSPYTKSIIGVNRSAIIPSLGLDKLFNGNQYVTIEIPMAVIIAIVIWIILDKTKFGYELKATGYNRHAAKYCGMAEKRNIVVTLIIGGALAGFGAALYYLTGIMQWSCSESSVPAMGFNGIAAAFLGGLNPIGSVFSSYFIQHITSGGAYIDKMVYSSQISDLISAIIIYLCGFVFFAKTALNRWLMTKDAASARKAETAKQVAASSETEKGGDAE